MRLFDTHPYLVLSCPPPPLAVVELITHPREVLVMSLFQPLVLLVHSLSLHSPLLQLLLQLLLLLVHSLLLPLGHVTCVQHVLLQLTDV